MGSTDIVASRLGYGAMELAGPPKARDLTEDEAVSFIRRSKDRPFFVYLAHSMPHTRVAASPTFAGKSAAGLFGDAVEELDAHFGRLWETLRAEGLDESTYIIFTSDNGPWYLDRHLAAPNDARTRGPQGQLKYPFNQRDERGAHFGSAGPLRGAKASSWEGGFRVPFIVRWPGHVKPGSVSAQLVQQSDLMATFAAVLGSKLPDHAGEDSVSLLPLLRGSDRPVREHAVSASIQGTPAVRSGSWKYIPAPGSGGWGKGGDQAQPVQLYNLADDLGETKNLAAALPEKVAEMKTLLEKLITAGRSTPGAPQQNDVEVKRYPVNSAATPKKKAK